MTLSEHEQESIEAFREYIEDSASDDERYGPGAHCDTADGSILATRFEAGDSSWFEIALCPSTPLIRVAFLTSDVSMCEELEQAVQESDGTLEGVVAAAFQEAGLDWPNPSVERGSDAEQNRYFATPLEIEDLLDLDFEQTRNKTMRMLEGYFLAFGPAMDMGEFEEFEEED